MNAPCLSQIGQNLPYMIRTHLPGKWKVRSYIMHETPTHPALRIVKNYIFASMASSRSLRKYEGGNDLLPPSLEGGENEKNS